MLYLCLAHARPFRLTSLTRLEVLASRQKVKPTQYDKLICLATSAIRIPYARWGVLCLRAN